MLLPIHIAAGGFAIVLGVVALLVTKGGIICDRRWSSVSVVDGDGGIYEFEPLTQKP
jgi:hypothetical protein